MSIESNKNQNNNVLWLSIGLAGGAIIAYWLMKDKLDKKEQALIQANQEKERELVKIQEKVQGLEQQLAKLGEELNRKNSNHPNQSFNLWSYLSQWLKKTCWINWN